MIRLFAVGPLRPPTIMGCLVLGLACGPQSESENTRAQVEPFDEPEIEWSPARYVAYRAPQAISVDGRLTETSWNAAEWTSDFVDIEGPSRPTPRFKSRAKMLWDSTYLYVAAEMEEPHVWATLTERDAVIYHDNDFEVFIDPDGDTHEYYELEINALGTEWDLFLVKPYRDGGPALNSWDIQGLETAVSVDGTINDPSDTDRGWTVEIAIPWKVLAEAAHRDAPPKGDDQWRVNFSRVEWRATVAHGEYVKVEEPAEGRARPEDNWVWSPQGLINMHYPEMWGFVQFSELEAGAGVEGFVPLAEDESRWFLRQVYYRQRSWFSKHGSFTDDAGALGVPDSSYDLKISATTRLFDAWVTIGSRELHIGSDGRVW